MDYNFISEEQYKIAENNGISRRNVYQRINAYGYSIEEAITKPLKKLKNHDPEILEKAAKIGVTREIYYNRISLGWSIEKASTTPKMTSEDKAKTFRERYTKYPKEYIEKAEENGIPYSTFKRRVLKGWSVEDAYTIKLMTKSEAGRITKKNKELNCDY